MFTDLPDGNYRVTIVPPAGSNLTTPTIVPVTLSAANRTIDTADFGLFNSAPGVSNLRLVKRITNITRNGVTVSGFDFSSFVDDPATQDDNASGWLTSARSLLGQLRVNGSDRLQTGDEITYTIYYLADGTNPIFNVNLCDQFPTGTSFLLNTNEIQRGSGSPTPGGTVFSSLAPLPTGNPCQNQTNPNGSVLFDVGDVLGNSSGFIRFRVRIN